MKPNIKIYSERVISSTGNIKEAVRNIKAYLPMFPDLDPCSVLNEQGKRLAIVSVKYPEINTY